MSAGLMDRDGPAVALARAGADIAIRRARPGDVPQLEAFVEPFVADGTLLRRTADELYRHVREFVVAERATGEIVGCVALRVHTAVLGEVCAVAVSERCRGHGLGRTLVEAAIGEAVALGLHRLFVLTRETAFFHALEFQLLADDRLDAVIGEQATRRHGGGTLKTAMLWELSPVVATNHGNHGS